MSAAVQTDWTEYDRPALRDRLLSADGRSVTAQLAVEGMHCGGCALKIERGLGALSGVERVSVNGATKRMQVRWDLNTVPFSRLLRTIAELGFVPRVIGAVPAADADGVREKRQALKRLAVAGLGMAQVMSFAFALYAGAAHGMDPTIARYLRLISLVVTVPVVFYSATPFFSGAWGDLKARRLGMDIPVSLATALAFAASIFNTLRDSGEVYFDSVTMFVFLLLLGRFIEMQTRHRSGSATAALAHLLPATVQRFRQGQMQTVNLAEIEAGDRLLVPAGAAIAADGRVLRGTARVDESLLTGESTPATRGIDDPVLGGSLNLGQPFEMTVTAAGASTVLASIVRLLERAQAERPRLGLLADRAAAWFVAGVLLLAAAVAGAWLYFDPSRAFAATLAVLVVTCPCALSLATPAAIAAATTRLARMGLLIAHPDAIEALGQAHYCVFDKTGTLTQGAPRVIHVTTYGNRSTNDCMKIAAALEAHSQHPLAGAFSAAAAPPATDVRELRGQGLEGIVDGTLFRIGQFDFAAAVCPNLTSAAAANASLYLADRTGILAAFDIDDALRPEAPAAVSALSGLGIESEIASGDRREAVEWAASRLKVTHWQARLTPEAKLARIRELNRRPGGAIMVGDGVNDAPVLGAARVSIAMGGGSALAHASADAILTSPSLTVLAESVQVARRTLHIVRQNLGWATAYNLLAVPLAAVGAVPPWAAAIGMSASSLLVVLNASRLSRKGAHPRGAA